LEITNLELLEFCDLANKRISDEYHKGFFSLEEKFSELVYGSNLLSTVAKSQLEAIHQNPHFEADTWGPSDLVLAKGPCWELRIGLYKHSSDLLYSLPYHMLIAVVGVNSLTVDVYKIQGDLKKSLFTHETRLSEPARAIYPPKSVLKVDSRTDVVDVIIDAPVLTVKLSSAIHDELQWAFRREDGRAFQPIVASPIDSNLVSMIEALGAMERSASAGILNKLTEHPQYFIRWAAMQALSRIAPDEAIVALARAAEDPHPHIRNAANKALRKRG
jgi:hypothetical protein